MHDVGKIGSCSNLPSILAKYPCIKNCEMDVVLAGCDARRADADSTSCTARQRNAAGAVLSKSYR